MCIPRDRRKSSDKGPLRERPLTRILVTRADGAERISGHGRLTHCKRAGGVAKFEALHGVDGIMSC
jgi:hypothetical protein